MPGFEELQYMIEGDAALLREKGEKVFWRRHYNDCIKLAGWSEEEARRHADKRLEAAKRFIGEQQ